MTTPIVKCKNLHGLLSTRDELFQQACTFASQLKRDQLINISHSVDSGKTVVAVWYWEE